MRGVVFSRIGVVAGALVVLSLMAVVGEGWAAQESGVVINEIMWDGVEYVELKNLGESEVVLDGWTLTRQQLDGEIKTIIQFGEADVVAAGGYFLLEKNEGATTVPADKVVPGLTLVNTGELVTLLNGEEVVVHQANQLGSWLAGENTAEGIAMERTEDDGWYTSTGNVGGRVGTPGEANSEPVVSATPEPGGEEDEGDEEEYSDAVIVNEFLPNPIGSDTAGEFIELKNTGDAQVDLRDWRLDDEEGGSSAYVIPEGTLVEEGQMTVFWRSETGLALNNGGDGVRLFSPDGEIKSEHSYEGSVAEGVARARDDEGVWRWSEVATPGEKNVIRWEQEEKASEDEKEYPNTLVINEFLPNPAGADATGEFIELKNTGEKEVDLEGWQLDDGEGGSGKHDIAAGVSLAAGGIKVFWRSDTKIALNNGGDEVRLFDPAGEMKTYYAYEESVGEGLSYNRRDDGEYVLSTTITPGEANVITAPSEDDDEGSGGSASEVAGIQVAKVQLKDIRGQAIGTVVETEGVVSAPPGIFGDKIMYMAGSGIQIYFYKEEYPELETGDKVRVKGELATSLGEYRVKLAAAEDVVVMGEGVAPEPHKVKTGEVGESLEGSLVVVAGWVTRTSGDTFYMDDGSGEVKVFIKKSTGIDKPKMKKGMAVTMMGIVSQTRTGYRILPRWQGDVRLGLVAGLTSFPGAGWLYPSFGGAGVVVMLVLVMAYRAHEPLSLFTG